MFEAGNWYEAPMKGLETRLNYQAGGQKDKGKLRRMVQVEYGLRLVEYLELVDEPLLALPALLTLHRLPRLHALGEEQWQWVIFAAQRLPHYIGNQRWQDDLSEYARLPRQAQLYRVSSAQPWEDQKLRDISQSASVDLAKYAREYDEIIRTRPPYKRYTRKLAEAGKTYTGYVQPNQEGPRLAVNFVIPTDLPVESLPSEDLESRLRRCQKPPRPPLSLRWEDLRQEAARMDEGTNGDWITRFENMHLLSPEGQRSDELHFEGLTHIGGMVGAGKSTLIKIIAHYLARTSDQVVAILVPSTMQAIEMAHELNQVLGCAWDQPAAVAYFGWSSRGKYIQQFMNEHGRDHQHFGQRWTSAACGLMAFIPTAQADDFSSAPMIGREPCERLIDPGKEEAERPTGQHKKSAQNLICPLSSRCPSHQKLRDMAQARIIVTTAGALRSVLPSFFDERRLMLADYLYERADLLLVDEADEVQANFDDTFVNEMPLWNLPQALFTTVDPVASESMRRDALDALQESWVQTLRRGPVYILPLMRLIYEEDQALRGWIGQSYFSAYRLFQTIARYMVGLPDFWPVSAMSAEQRDQYEALSRIFSLLTKGDFTRLPSSEDDSPEALRLRAEGLPFANELISMLDKATQNVPSTFTDRLVSLMRRMTKSVGVSLDASLQALANPPAEADAQGETQPRWRSIQETPESLATKLLFALLAAGLDRQISKLIYESDAQPDAVYAIMDTANFNPAFNVANRVLPIAYSGQIFGTYFTPQRRPSGQARGQRAPHEALSRLEYINPGRELLLNFPHLYHAFGVYGPHVACLSATSYLPNSTRWHLRVPVTTILGANPRWTEQIQRSEYLFQPAFDQQGQPVRISGSRYKGCDDAQSKLKALEELAQAWKRHRTLESELDALEALGASEPELWADRARLLIFVNSYDQAEALAQALRSYLSEEHVEYLAPSAEEGLDQVTRANVESLVENTQVRVLVAPLAALGRGHNILNADNKAAFGTVYFAIRPLDPPGEVRGLAAELNAMGPVWMKQIEADQPLHKQEARLRQLALERWHQGERRQHYRHLSSEERADLAATSLGRFIQAVGRLVRGGVPMRVRFVDAAWAPESAQHLRDSSYRKHDNARSSLLVAMMETLESLISGSDAIGQNLYRPFQGFIQTENVHRKQKGHP